MKTLRISRKTLAVVLALAGMSASTQAQSSLEQSVQVTSVKDAKAVNMYVNDTDGAEYEVSLLSSDNAEIWSGTYLGSMAKSFVLEQLPEGSYKMVVKANEEYFELPLSINKENTVELDRRTFRKSPTVAVIGRDVLVDYNTEVKGSPVVINIYDGEGRLVHESTMTDAVKRMTRFDMSQLDAGKYQIVFDIEGNRFTRTVRID